MGYDRDIMAMKIASGINYSRITAFSINGSKLIKLINFRNGKIIVVQKINTPIVTQVDRYLVLIIEPKTRKVLKKYDISLECKKGSATTIDYKRVE